MKERVELQKEMKDLEVENKAKRGQWKETPSS